MKERGRAELDRAYTVEKNREKKKKTREGASENREGECERLRYGEKKMRMRWIFEIKKRERETEERTTEREGEGEFLGKIKREIGLREKWKDRDDELERV